MGKVSRLLVASMIAGATVVSVAGAQPSAPDVTDIEFKCMLNTAKAGAKFWTAKTKCVSKCLDRFWDDLVPESDCLPPYGGATAACIADSALHVKGAEDKFSLAIRKACDPTFKPGTQCPGCYSGGNCGPAGEAGERVQSFENQVDSFVPGIFCERAGAFYPLEQRCQLTTAKRIAKFMTAGWKCHSKCFSNARKGLVAPEACMPPVSDPTTAACLIAAEAPATYYIDHDCNPPPASPDNCGSPYPTGAEWTNLAHIALDGNVPGAFCSSPSGAFLD